MTRRSLFTFGAALVISAACSSRTPTEPERAPNTMAPDAGALLDGTDSTCRSGWSNPNGKTC